MTKRTEKFLSQRVDLFLSHMLIFPSKIFTLFLCPAYEMVITGVLDAWVFYSFLDGCIYLIPK